MQCLLKPAISPHFYLIYMNTNGAFRRTYSVNIWVKVKIFRDVAKCYDLENNRKCRKSRTKHT